MASEHLQAFWKAIEETEPNKLEGLSLQALQSYYEKLSAILPYLLDGRLVTSCRDRIELLRREIELRRIEERGERQHTASYKIEKQIRFWAIVGGVTGIALFLIAVWPLVHDTFFSRAPPDSAPQPTPATPHQSQSPTNAEAAPATSSNSATPSPEQEATAQPSSESEGDRPR